MSSPGNVTQVLKEMSAGNERAAEELLPLVYEELRKLADHYLRDQPSDHTWQPTALVHEVYIRLVGHNKCTWENRAQFFAVGAKAMRNLLIDHARRRNAAKRRGDRGKLSLDETMEPSEYRDKYLVALDDALTELSTFDPHLSRIVELRFFGGLTTDESARSLGVSPMTVKRRWKIARCWLHREIMKGS